MSAGIHARVRGADVSFRDVTIKIPDRKYDQGDVNDVMHQKHAWRILGDSKKVS